ncbi:MAG: hypothetical protein JXB36_15080 [Gammaproteobacteria bacterium]|nr:hypothetical protein [Gammaproteobacteria bacterium]
MRSMIALSLLALTGAAGAAAVDPAKVDRDRVDPVEQLEIDELGVPQVTSLEPVDSIPALRRLHSWHAVDNDTLIVWSSPFDPYLVELFRPSHDLKFAWTIGITSFGSRIHAKFDAVEVGGFSYPISRIYKLSRDDAKALAKHS